MSRRPAYRVLATPEFEDWFKTLREGNETRKLVIDMKAALSENVLCGEQVPRDRIPTSYVKKYDLKNLYRYKHPKGYRSCYTLLSEGDKRVSVVVLDFMDHNRYDDLFGYD